MEGQGLLSSEPKEQRVSEMADYNPMDEPVPVSVQVPVSNRF